MSKLPPEPERFSQFMQRALYDPQRGYYTARIRTVGARGDFSTTATLSNRLGRAIAAWLKTESQTTGVRTVIEIGGGDGSLMRSALNSLGWWQRLRLRFLMVESSPVLTAQQRQKAGRAVSAWYTTLPEALQACGGQALIYSNELLDAFPVDLVQWDGTSWQEVWVTRENGQTQEHQRPLAMHADEARDFSVLRWQPVKPQRAELHSTLRSWFAHWLPLWHKGSMLAIDYGGEMESVYHRRPRGTMRAYFMQQRLEGPEIYANPGHQDLTCDVNFTDVRAWLTAQGLQETAYESQGAFLHRLAGPGARTPADDYAADQAGAGGAFQCLSVRHG